MTTALDGPAFVTRLPMSFSSARTRPNVSPTTMMSPTLSVPVWTSAVATGPRPLSSCASTIVPTAARFGLALSSWRSATSRIISISSSRPEARLRRDRHERHVAAVLLDDDAGLGQLGLDPVRVGIGLVDLVERDDDRHLGRLRVADRLERLGHDAVVRRDHDDGDVGDPRAAGAHRGERLVTRRVEEDDALAVLGDLARADVLGDAAALAGRDLGRPDRVEQARLAVVDVAHDGHDRGARLEEARVVLLEEDLLGRLGASCRRSRRRSRALADGRARLGDLVAELARDERRGVAVDELVDRREDAALDELADDVRRVDRQQLGELLDGDRRGQLDRATLRGSATCTLLLVNAPSRRGGLRGPRRPRVPLLLLATGSSFDDRVRWLRPPASRAGRPGAGSSSARPRAPLVDGLGAAGRPGRRRRRRDRAAGRSGR